MAASRQCVLWQNNTEILMSELQAIICNEIISNTAYCISVFYCRGDIALIGLAVMGQNLILNMNDHGFTVSEMIIIS